MRNNEILDLLEVEDLTDDMRMVAKTCGIEVVRRLMSQHAGLTIYIPNITKMPDLVKRYLRMKYDGCNAVDIARDLHVSHRYVQGMVSEITKTNHEPGGKES